MATPNITNEKSPEELVQTLTEANERIMGTVGKLVKQLRHDREQFAFYAENHREKGTEDGNRKAETNMGFVKDIDTLLEQEKLSR